MVSCSSRRDIMSLFMKIRKLFKASWVERYKGILKYGSYLQLNKKTGLKAYSASAAHDIRVILVWDENAM
jgi:hypothetical protein